MHTCDHESPLGKMLLAADDEGLTGAWFYGQRYFARGLEDAEKNERRGVPFDSPVLLAARRWLDAYFAGERPEVPSRFLRTFRQPHRPALRCGYSSSSVTSR